MVLRHLFEKSRHLSELLKPIEGKEFVVGNESNCQNSSAVLEGLISPATRRANLDATGSPQTHVYHLCFRRDTYGTEHRKLQIALPPRCVKNLAFPPLLQKKGKEERRCF